ncbi:hypothetical protein G6F56_005462 [Rhizopus delemar]|uniref:Uncharacterized protein n=1 Tax=Rhizopus stolonifer TaxID=4846 RepID=A0A367IQ01_RHIST|nr:hypothetical protein G6F56_005462 [Rhizopus delemar]RCH79733.1 hypothetical protein CU098_003951 [Rhizopus stolonifer]
MSISSVVIDQPTKAKKNTWKWWQTKNPEEEGEQTSPTISIEENDSLAPSSLLAQRSIHSRESDDMESTTSVKSKAWTFHLKSENSPLAEEQDDAIPANNLEGNIGHRRSQTPPSSLLHPVPSITSSTIPVFNYNMDEPRRKSLDGFFFPGLRAKLGKWVGSKEKPQDSK